MVNFLPTWERGISYNWKSKNWGGTKPVLRSQEQPESSVDLSEPESDSHIEPGSDFGLDSGSEDASAPATRRLRIVSDSDASNMPDSQDLQVRPMAVSDEFRKADMRITCIRCFKGNGFTSPFFRGEGPSTDSSDETSSSSSHN